MKILLIFLLFVYHSAFAQKYVVDSVHSTIGFSVKHLGLFPVKGRFKKYDGTVTLKGKTMTASLEIDVDSINTDNEDRDAHLKSKDFFHIRDDLYEIVPHNRYIQFTSRDFSLNDGKIKGELKILKTKKKITLNSKVSIMKMGEKIDRIGISARGRINRKDFGLTWQKPATGAKEKIAGKFVDDEVDIVVDLVFKKN